MYLINRHQFHRLEVSGADPDTTADERHWLGFQRQRLTTMLRHMEQLSQPEDLETLIREMELELREACESPVAVAPAWLYATECA